MNHTYHINHSTDNNLNPNRVFILQKSKLEKRLDPLYYFEILNNKVLFNCRTEKLSKVVKSLSGGTPSKNVVEYWNGNILWASPKDMKEFYLCDTEDKISDAGLKNSAATLAPKNSVLIVFRSGILKHTLPVAITMSDTAINQDLKVLIPTSDIIPEYLAVYLKTFQETILPIIVKNSTTVQSINQEEFNSLPIPIPSKLIQERVISIHKQVISQKQKNEAEAEKLLSSIDDYLLKELGITLPEPPKNTLRNRMFVTTLQEVAGGRFDPKLYSTQSKELIKSLYKTSFKYKTLKSVIIQSCAGDWGNEDKEVYNDSEFVRCLVIRATEFDNKFNLNVDGSRAKYRLINKAKYKALDIQANDLLIEKSGGSENQPVGRVSILTKELTNNLSLGFSNFVHKFRVNDNVVNPEFVFNYLKTIHNIKITDVMQSQTNGIRNLILNEYLNLPIPIPPPEKQKEIAEHITAIRQQAQQLKDKTKELLKKANEEIEKILLN